MKNLFNLLERFSRSLNKDTFTKEAIASVVKERTGVQLPLESLTLKEGVLSITASPAIKNEINLKEESIKSQLTESHKISLQRIIYK